MRLLEELAGCDVLSQAERAAGLKITAEDVASILDQIARILNETFQAALDNPVHFQVPFQGFPFSTPRLPLIL